MSALTPPSSALLAGWRIESERHADVHYEIVRLVAHGGMGSAYLAERHAPEGSSPVVVKIVHPELADGHLAPELVAVKETVALTRIGEGVPPTPYVVRYVESGSSLPFGERKTSWIALEYVHGGIEGTTLEERIAYSVHRTGYAFDPVRAAHALHCIASGLSAIHAASVLHRDLSPGNVLCCGLGDAEVCKISDFGVARAVGLAQTFHGMKVGTLGYTAPEAGSRNAGASSDVFSLAALVYFLLTGQHYFEVDNPVDALTRVAAPERRSVRLHTTLSPELSEHPEACARIDALLAGATRLVPTERPQSAQEFARLLRPALLDGQSSPLSSRRVVTALLSERLRPSNLALTQWIEKSHPVPERFIRSTAWDSEGRALALTSGGVLFWDGNVWLDAHGLEEALPHAIRAVARHEGGGWLVWGGPGMLGVVDEAGGVDLLEAQESRLSYCFASGHIDDLVLAIRTLETGPSASGFWTSDTAELVFFQERRVHSTKLVPAGLQINTLRRLSETSWLIGGRKQADGGGFAMIYEPVGQKFTELRVPALRAFVAGGSRPERNQALLAGSDGVLLRVLGSTVDAAEIPGRPDLSAAAIDILGSEWLASTGALWNRSAEDGAFREVWSNPGYTAPFISLLAEPGRILAVTCDGAVIEGLFRFEERTS